MNMSWKLGAADRFTKEQHNSISGRLRTHGSNEMNKMNYWYRHWLATAPAPAPSAALINDDVVGVWWFFMAVCLFVLMPCLLFVCGLWSFCFDFNLTLIMCVRNCVAPYNQEWIAFYGRSAKPIRHKFNVHELYYAVSCHFEWIGQRFLTLLTTVHERFFLLNCQFVHQQSSWTFVKWLFSL